MSAKEVRATARVKVTLDVYLDQPWGPEMTVGQVHEDAKREALSKVECMVQDRKGIAARIVGEPVVDIIVGQVSR